MLKNSKYFLLLMVIPITITIKSYTHLLPLNNNKKALNYIKQVLKKENPVIVEAGAFDGTDTLRMSKIWPQGKIFSFEPIPEVYKRAIEKTKKQSNVKIFNYALSEKSGPKEIYISNKKINPTVVSAQSSLYPPSSIYTAKNSKYIFNNTLTIKSITLDDWVKKFSVSNVDMLWLDLQGYELNALRGASNLLKSVKLIYTEVELVELYKGQPLYHDVKSFLEKQGFKLIAKDFKDKSSIRFGNAIFFKG